MGGGLFFRKLPLCVLGITAELRAGLARAATGELDRALGCLPRSRLSRLHRATSWCSPKPSACDEACNSTALGLPGAACIRIRMRMPLLWARHDGVVPGRCGDHLYVHVGGIAPHVEHPVPACCTSTCTTGLYQLFTAGLVKEPQTPNPKP